MFAYRIELELRSGLGTPLAAETLWGHVCWGIRYGEGAAALQAWLERYDTPEPPLVLADPFPVGYWPRPALPPAPRPVKPPRVEEADDRKRVDQLGWVSHAAWRTCADVLTPERLHQAVRQSPPPPTSRELAVTHAGVNRLTGGTAQAGGGVLFTNRQRYYPEPVRFDVWVRSPESLGTVRRWLEQGLAGGYGRDASSGLGEIAVVGAEPFPLPAAPRSNAVMLLGPAVPRPGDPARGFFQVGVRCGRVGGDFAIGPLPDGSTQRQKRPVHCLQAGTILFTDDAPPFIGRVLRNVHAWSELRHYGLGLTLPLRLDPALLTDSLTSL